MLRGERAMVADLQLAGAAGDISSTGEGWANPKYGDYYATSTPAYRAVKLRADAVSSAPLRVYQTTNDGVPEAVPANHPIQNLLNKVNPWWTSSDLWKATETNLSLWGAAFWFLENGSNGMPKAIWLLPAPKVVPIADKRKGRANQYIAGFKYARSGGDIVPLLPEEVVWFRYYNPLDELAGLAPVAPVRQTLDMGRNAVTFNSAFFKNGAMPQDLVFTTNGPVPDEEIEAFYLRLEQRHRGPSRAHRPMVWDLSQGSKPERMGVSQKDMEFLASLNFTVEEAARVWGVPPPKLYSQTQSIYNNVRQADIEFYTDTVSHEWRFLETEVNEMLMPLVDPSGKLFVSFDLSGILPLQEALAEKYARDRLDVQAGILTINEVRRSRNLTPVDWGESWWVPMTTVPAGSPLPSELSPAEPRSLTGWSAAPDESQVFGEFNRAFTKGRRAFGRLQRELFAKQRLEALTKLHQRLTIPTSAGELLGDGWPDRFAEAGIDTYTDILSDAAEAHSRIYRLGPFNDTHPMVQEWVRERIRFWSGQVNEETGRLLMLELDQALKLGEGIPEISERIRSLFRDASDVRAETIARTESLAASNQGHLAIYEQSGLVDAKMWLTQVDDRTRPEHVAAHRQVVPRTDRFLVGGEMLDAPGLGGSAANVINCRCTVAPMVST